MTPDESYIHFEYNHWACWINREIKACTNSNPWGTDTLAYCIDDQNYLHKHLHCHQDILQRNFSFQHILHLKTQVFDFHIIHFLKTRAR